LNKVASHLTRQRELILLIDGLDHLRPDVAVQSLSWLPNLWPKYVHVVLTTDSGDGLSLRNIRNHISHIVRDRNLDRSVVDRCFFEIAAFNTEEQDQMLEYLLQNSQRKLTSSQHEVH